MLRYAFIAWAGVSLWAAEERVDFARDIRPLLSDRCFTCHGPDAAERKADLRLDIESEAKKPRGTRVPVVAGDSKSSEVYRRITAQNALRMPPSYSGRKSLNDRETGLIKRWIEQGGKWQSHWAFIAPERPALPAVKNAKWPRNAIDSFVLAKLEKENMQPSSEADRARLLRRVSFDLTGLPPTLAEVDAFVRDQSPGAWEKVVDRLLASPRYGERMAADWLDAARYADTHGYQVDPEKEMWAWRDWVTQSFNRNQPYDQFTVEQLAGDLLPNATLEQKVATGFQRNHRVNTEAGSIAAEYHVENIVDRISTMGTVWLGLTVGCARCHDHKYDPLKMKDFYSLFAFFNAMPEVGTGGPRDGRGNLQPALKLPAPDLEAQLVEFDEKLKKARADLRAVEDRLAARQADWEKTALSHQPEWRVLEPLDVKSREGVKLTRQPDGSWFASGTHPDKDVLTVNVQSDLKNITGFRLELLPDDRLPGGGSGRGPNGRAVLTSFDAEFAPQAGADKMRKLDLGTITSSFSSAESILTRVLNPMQQLPRGWSVEPQLNQPHYVVIEPRTLAGADGGTRFRLKIGSEYGGGQLIGRFRLSVTNDEFPNVMPEDVTKILQGTERTKEQSDTVRRYFLARLLERRVANDEVARLTNARRTVENKIPSTMVMRDMASARESFMLTRGQYDQRGEKVEAAIPGFLPPLPAGAPANRLGLARWLVDSSNPLTARVAVNRFWQGYFGTGLVKTSEDFGSQGDPPSHPELLDWLATEFVSSGWDVKAMQKLIVMSATYRQTSKVTPASYERDPENRLLARGPRFRLPAEMIRDQALLAAGLLKEKLGGPPVKPYQPDGLWEQLSVIDDRKLYDRSAGDDLWRRSLYTYWKRTVPPPTLSTFDAPTREFCVIRRSRSSTPLQALAMLNDETYVEAARVLAERMIREGGDTASSRIAHGFRLATSRVPGKAEMATLQAGLERRLTEYQRDSKAAADLLGVGEAPRNQSTNAAELAAYTTVASVILNLDEVITKQ